MVRRTLKRRRRESKTDYKLRKNILKSGIPRIVIRRTNRYFVVQAIESVEAQDKVIAGVTSKELLKKGWDAKKAGSLKSIPAGYLTGITGQSIENLSDVAAMTPTDGQLLTWNNTGSYWEAADAPVSLPSQTGHSGEYLTTDGSTASWASVSSNTTSAGLYEMANTISSNYSITSGNNALSAGPITIDSGVSVTVPTGSTWVIA